ncbi:MAG: Ig-like domain repeat protein, partial [Deltaproteobacteria bacterium]
MKTLAAIFALATSFFATSVSAQNTYTAYINSDNSAASGCTITLPGGTFAGADLRVQATVTPGATPAVSGVTLTACSGGTFGAGTSIGGGSVDLNTGVSGSDSVEFSVPGTGIVTGGGQTLAFGFTAESPTGSDVMFTTNGGPIIFGITVPTPALGAGALVLLVLLVMGMAHRFGRTRWYRHMAALSLVAMCGVALAAAFNWTGIAPIATDPSGDPTNGSPDIDLRAGFVALSSGTLYIRIDVADLQTQAPQITSANATTFIVGQAGTFTATSIGVPSAALALSGCTLPAGVTFVDNGNGTATLAGTPGPGTANTYACTLTASNGIPPNATQAFTLTVANAPSQTALVADINPSVFAQTVTFTATVTPAPPGSGTPTGTVNFLDGATNIGSGTLNGSGVATFATGTLAVATHPITAQYAGDVNFGPSTSSVVNQVVNQASQTITFTSTAPAGATVGGATYTVTATASSGLTVALTIDASSASVCSLTGSTVSFIGVGTCVIDANQAGDANYTAATQVQQSFAVGKGSQTITFTSTAPAAATVGGTTYAVTATSSAGLTPVTFTIDASATSVCSISGSTVSFIGVGTCLIDANQAGNANYNAAPQA